MKKVIAIVAGVAVVALLVVLFATGTVGGSGGGYQIQALFDNAGLAVPGETVRIAGANVGTVGPLTVTKDNLASVTLEINNTDFEPWYSDATCTIRPQSLIGERYIDCEPGRSTSAPLQKIQHGPDAGQYILPVDRTSSPIDTDIVQDISQDSVRQSLSLILNELGTGLAARGSDLNQVILRANPALGQTEKVLHLLGTQDKTLAQLATNASEVLGPLAKSRTQLANFIKQANTVAGASASERQQLAQSIADLPGFLTKLRPLMANLDRLATSGTPDLKALGSSAGSLNTAFKELVPFANKSKTALQNLATAAQKSQGYLEASLPLVREVREVAASANPPAQLLNKLSASLQHSGAIQQLMGLLFYAAGADNGYDADGHYVRIAPVLSGCTGYARNRGNYSVCSANFGNSSGAPAPGTTVSAAEINAEARTAAADALRDNSGSGTTTTAAEQRLTARIATEALRRSAGGDQRISGQQLSGLLHYLTGRSR
jgi:virulence factor Mce-like protein